MLNDQQRHLYARQVLLAELGPAGQERLCASEVSLAQDADARAAAVTRAYLERAGLQLTAAGGTAVAVASAADVAQLAGEPGLEECAAWLLGAWAAVETIKQVSEVGTAHVNLDPSAMILNTEVL